MCINDLVFNSLRSLSYKIPVLKTDLFAVCKSAYLLNKLAGKAANI